MLIKNICILLGVYVARLVVPLLVIPILARVMNVSDYGIYMYSVAFAGWLAIFIEYGFMISSTREVASSASAGAIARIVTGTESAKVILGLATFPLAVGAIYLFPPFAGHEHWAIVSWLLGLFTALSPIYYFQGRETLKLVGYVELGAGCLLLLLVFIVIRQPADAFWLPMIVLIPRILATAILSTKMRNSVGLTVRNCYSRSSGIAFLKSGFHFFVFQAAVSLYTTFNIVFLGFFCSPAQVGAYATAERLMRAGIGLIGQCSSAIFPRLSALKASKSLKLNRLRLLTLISLFGVAVVGSILTYILAPHIEKHFLGGNVEHVAQILQVLSLLVPAVALSNVLGFHYLIVDHHERSFNRIIISAAVVNLIIAYALVSTFGLVGMAYSWVTIEWLITLSTGAMVLYFMRSSVKNSQG